MFYAIQLCLGMIHEITVDVRARYKMLENTEPGTACTNNNLIEDNEYDCYLRCRLELIVDMCNCTAPTLSNLGQENLYKKLYDTYLQATCCQAKANYVTILIVFWSNILSKIAILSTIPKLFRPQEAQNYSNECPWKCLKDCDQVNKIVVIFIREINCQFRYRVDHRVKGRAVNTGENKILTFTLNFP